jgi:hypothetical protein
MVYWMLQKRMRWTIFVFCPTHFHVFLLHEKVTDDEGVPSLVSNLSVQGFYHMKKLLMTGKSSVFYHREKGRVRVTGTDDEGWKSMMMKGGSVEVKAPSETAAVDIVAREQDSPAGRRNKKIENTDFDIVARNSLRHHKKKKE